jgi:predicted GNAT family acetyltransferase
MEITNNKKLYRFETQLEDGEYGILEYRWLKGSMVLMHTLVPPSGRGKGIGSALAKYVLEYARAQNLKVIVYCPFVTEWLKTHHEYDDVLDTTPKR